MLLALLALPLALAQQSPLEREIQRHLDQIRSDNRDIRELSGAATSRAVVEQIQRKSRQIDERLDVVASLTTRLAHQRPPGPPPPPTGPIPANPADFGVALAAVKSESFPGDRVERLKDVARDRHFTVDQVLQLIGAFDFPDRQVEVAVMLYPRTVDQQNWFRVYDVFTFSSHKDEVRRRLGL